MKRARFTDEQIIGILKGEAGTPASELCRKHGVSDASTYKWKANSATWSIRSQATKDAGKRKHEAETAPS